MRRGALRLAGMTNPGAQLRLFRPGRGSGPRYGSLLLILIVTYLLSALTVAVLVSAVQVVLFLAVVLIALRGGRFRRRTGQIIAVVLLLGSAVAAILELVDNEGPGAGVASLWTALILLLAVFYIVRQVLAQPQITEQSIYGVVSAYLMIGLIFAAVYLAMFRFSHQFFVHGPDDTKTFQYFSFTTLTTLGYGDFTAASDAGRAVAVLEAVAGQMFLATLVARLVAGFRWSDRAAARHGRVQAAPGADQEQQVSGTGSGPGDSRPAAAPLPPGSGEPGAGQPGTGLPRPGSGRSRAKKASAPGLIRLSPPGTVRGRGTRPGPGERKGAGQSGPAPARPDERT
jgi:drug/metabolite transporter (DMT)-like permease